jgi:hypothetical protein
MGWWYGDQVDGVPDHARQMHVEGGRIAALLVFWGVLAAVGRYGIGNIGYARPGRFFFELGTHLGVLFALTGLASVLLYAIARGIQLAEN